LLERTTDRVIGIGASTGGVAALTRILPMFPASTPAIVVVQHMPAGFTADFARRRSGAMAMRIAEARHGDRLLRGHVLVAPGGDRHLEVERVGGEYRVVLRAGAPVSGHRPSVDVFFRSLARAAGKNASAALLTGMGADGAEGLLELKSVGGFTVIQDKATCAVWGMPAAASELGAHTRDAPLDQLPLVLLEHEARVSSAESPLRRTAELTRASGAGLERRHAGWEPDAEVRRARGGLGTGERPEVGHGRRLRHGPVDERAGDGFAAGVGPREPVIVDE
jgi:two-component system chemotaxis response regulator CheB